MDNTSLSKNAWNDMSDRGYFKYWEDKEGAFSLSHPEIINSRLSPSKEKTILEVGCGYGRESRSLAGIFGKFVGWDVCPNVLQKAKDYHKDYSNMTFCEWPKEIGSEEKEFDCLYTYGTMQHCEDDVIVKLLSDASMRMKAGSQFIVEFQVYNGGSLEQQHRNNGYVSLMRSLEEILPLLKASGLEYEEHLDIKLDSGTVQLWVYGSVK